MLGSQGNWDFFILQAVEEVQGFKQGYLSVPVWRYWRGEQAKNARILWEAEENRNSRPSNTMFADPLDVVCTKSIIKLGCTLALNFFFHAFLRHEM